MNHAHLRSLLFASQLGSAGRASEAASNGTGASFLPPTRAASGLKSAARMPRSAAPAAPSVKVALDTMDTPAGREAKEPLLLLEKLSLKTRVHPEVRQAMSALLACTPIPAPPPQRTVERAPSPSRKPAQIAESSLFSPSLPAATPVPATPHVSGPLQLTLPSFMALKTQILDDLEANLGRLLTLNVSRREAISQHLDRLAGQPPGAAATGPATGPHADASLGICRWIEGPRSPAQSCALQAYFEEIALILLGQAVLLKAWSDRGLRRWSEADLRDLNWTMNTVLKPYVPLDRESWQVARQNIYSWYKPSAYLQREIWYRLEAWKIGEEGPQLLNSLFSAARRSVPEYREAEGYDPRFLKAIWDHAPLFGFDPRSLPGPLRRAKTVFSPTLRDGAMVREGVRHGVQCGATTVNWIGLESSAMQLVHCELMQLWWGPSSPPLWTIGNGLEAHTRDQLSLALGSPKPSLLSRIAEMEACDLAFVLEERAVRAQGRTPEALRFREQVEAIPYFRKLRSSHTTLGDLQACVALSKLRPGGLLFWAREEALDERDGREALNYLLDRAKLVCEWNLSELAHSLPMQRPLFSKHLYLFSREPRGEDRMAHRPLRVTLRGSLRSHVELPILFEDLFDFMRRSGSPRGNWQILVHQSPTEQRDWADRWPDPACQQTIQKLEELRERSLPLATATTIRHTPEGDPSRQHGWMVHPSLRGFWIQAHSGGKPGTDGRRLVAHALPRAGRDAHGQGFLVLLADDAAVAPLKHYLQSETVSQWLEQHCERKGDRWLLTEQLLRILPVPRQLLESLRLLPEASDPGQGPCSEGRGGGLTGRSSGGLPSFALPLPGAWEKIASELTDAPERAREAIEALRRGSEAREEHTLAISTEIFVRAARALEHLEESIGPLLSLVTAEGKVRWSELLKILSPAELVPVSLHPLVTLVGTLPQHLAIGHITTIKIPKPGILLATELGPHLKLLTETTLLLDMLVDQLEGVQSPTWSELLTFLRLPRRPELAEATASDILQLHGKQACKVRELREVIACCPLV